MFDVYGDSYYIHAPSGKTVLDKLPPLTYLVKFDPIKMQFFLEIMEDFEIPSKVYGDINTLTERLITTFLDRKGSTGILLTGEKGSGKSLQAKNLCKVAGDKYGVPTIVLNQPFQGDGFSEFLTYIKQPKIVFIDEFEKVYDSGDNDNRGQNGLLTLLDGVFISQTMFIMTANEEDKINSFMLNRPGRIFYKIKYDGLTEEFVRLYSEDNLKDKKYLNDILNIFAIISDFNFDILKALIEEINRYDQAPSEFLKIMNVDASETKWNADILTKEGAVIDSYVSGFVRTGANILALDNFTIRFTEYIEDKKTSKKNKKDDFDDIYAEYEIDGDDVRKRATRHIIIKPSEHYVGMKNKSMIFQHEKYVVRIYAQKTYTKYYDF